jgi:hypothetical protein
LLLKFAQLFRKPGNVGILFLQLCRSRFSGGANAALGQNKSKKRCAAGLLAAEA